MSRAGRKRKLVKRQPNGQPYRPPADAREVVIDARMRHFKVTKQRAVEQWAGYEFGRMAMKGLFGHPSDAQRAVDAVEEYVQAVADYMRVKAPQMPMPRAMDYMAGRGTSLSAGPSDAQVRRIVIRYEDAIAKLAPAGGIARMAFHDVVFHDRPCAPDRVIAVETCVRLLQGR